MASGRSPDLGCFMKLLVVEDDPVIRGAICDLIRHWGHAADDAADGAMGWSMLQDAVYDLVILDLNLPRMDGLEVCRRLRQSSLHQPLVLMLTARDTSADTVAGLDHGADDYIVKPFDPELLRARVTALLRRASRPLTQELAWGSLLLDRDQRTAWYAGADLQLTPKEHLLLEALLQAQGKTCSKEQLLNAAWGWSDTPGEESVKTHVKNIRSKLAARGAPSDFVETVYGVGFRMNGLHSA